MVVVYSSLAWWSNAILRFAGLLRDVAVIRDTARPVSTRHDANDIHDAAVCVQVWHLADERSILTNAAQDAKEFRVCPCSLGISTFLRSLTLGSRIL